MDTHLNQFLDNDWQILLGDLSSSSFNQTTETATVNPLELRYPDNNHVPDSFANGYLKNQNTWKPEQQQRAQQHVDQSTIPNGYNHLSNYGNVPRTQQVNSQPEQPKVAARQPSQNGFEFHTPQRTDLVQPQRTVNKYQNTQAYESVSSFGQQRQQDSGYSQGQYQRPQNEHFLNQQYATRLESATQALNPARTYDSSTGSNQLPNFNSFRHAPLGNQKQQARNEQQQTFERQQDSELPQMNDMTKIQQIQKWLQSSNPDDSLNQLHDAEPVYAKVTQPSYQMVQTPVRSVETSQRPGKLQPPKVSVDDVINQFKIERSNSRTNVGTAYQSLSYKGANAVSDGRENPSYNSGTVLSKNSQGEIGQRVNQAQIQYQRQESYSSQLSSPQTPLSANYRQMQIDNQRRVQETSLGERNHHEPQRRISEASIQLTKLNPDQRVDKVRVVERSSVNTPVHTSYAGLHSMPQQTSMHQQREPALQRPPSRIPTTPQPYKLEELQPIQRPPSRVPNSATQPLRIEETQSPGHGRFPAMSQQQRDSPVQRPPSRAPSVTSQRSRHDEIQNSVQAHYGLKNAVIYGQDPFKVPDSSRPVPHQPVQSFGQVREMRSEIGSDDKKFMPIRQQLPPSYQPSSSLASSTTSGTPVQQPVKKVDPPAYPSAHPQSSFGEPTAKNESRMGPPPYNSGSVLNFSEHKAAPSPGMQQGLQSTFGGHAQQSTANQQKESSLDPLGSLDLSQVPLQLKGLKGQEGMESSKVVDHQRSTPINYQQKTLQTSSKSYHEALPSFRQHASNFESPNQIARETLDLSKQKTAIVLEKKVNEGVPKKQKRVSHPKLMITEPPTQFCDQLDLQIDFAEDEPGREGSVPILIKENPQSRPEPQAKATPKSFVQLYPNMVFQNEGDGEFVVEKVEKVGSSSVRDMKASSGSSEPTVSKAERPSNYEMNGGMNITSVSGTTLNLAKPKPTVVEEESYEPPVSKTPEPLDPEKPWNLTCVISKRVFRRRPVIKNKENPLPPNDSYRGSVEQKKSIPTFPCKKKCCNPLVRESYENHKKMYMHLILGSSKGGQAPKAHAQNSTVPMKIVLSLKPPAAEPKTPLPAHAGSSGKLLLKPKEGKLRIPGSAPRGRPRKPENLNKSPTKQKRGRKSINLPIELQSTPVAQAALGLLSLTPSLVGSPKPTPSHDFSPPTPQPVPYKFKTKAELKQVQQSDLKPPFPSSSASNHCASNPPNDLHSPISSVHELISPMPVNELLSPESLVKKKAKKHKRKIPELLVAEESEKYGEECAIMIVENKKYVPPPTPPPTHSSTPPPVIEKHDVWDDMFSHSLENFCSELCHTGVKRVKRTETKDSLPPVLEANLPQPPMPPSPASADDEELPLTARLKTKKSSKRSVPERVDASDEDEGEQSDKLDLDETFYPGWEGELVEFKKTLRTPTELISVPRTIQGEGLKLKIKKAFLKKDIKFKRFKKKFSSGPSGFDYLRKKKKKIVSKDARPESRSLPTPVPGSSLALLNRTPPLDVGVKLKEFSLNKSVGETLLHKVTRVGYLEGVAYLLSKPDSDPSVKDNAGYTPLHEACGKGHLAIANLLLMCGADVSASAQGGIRPLHEAAEFGNIELVRLLIAYGADPTLGTYNGVTPLQLTSNNAIKLLITSHIQDIEGKPVLEWDIGIGSSDHCGYDPMEDTPAAPASTLLFEMSEHPLPRTSYCTTAKERHVFLSDVAELSSSSINSLRKRLEARTVRKDEYYFKYAPDTVGTIPDFGDSTGFVEYNSELMECLKVETMSLENQ